MSISGAKHHDHGDGTVTVDYYDENGVHVETEYWCDSRRANVESLLRMFPGTSRAWLESVVYRTDAEPGSVTRARAGRSGQ